MLYSQIADTMNKIEQGGISIHYLKHLQDFSYYKRLLYQSNQQEIHFEKLCSKFTSEQKDRFHVFWGKHCELFNEIVCKIGTIPFYYHDNDLENSAILFLHFQVLKEILKNDECKITLCWYYINEEFSPFEFMDHFSTLKKQETNYISKKILLESMLQEYQSSEKHYQKVQNVSDLFSPIFSDIKQ